MFAPHEKLLLLHAFDLPASPVGLTSLHLLTLHFTFLFKLFDVDLLYLKFNSS